MNHPLKVVDFGPQRGLDRNMIHLAKISLKPDFPSEDEFPFNLPVFDRFSGVDFKEPVTFFVGENGSGKSTLLEAVACAVGAITIGGEDVERDRMLAAPRELARHLKLTWRKRTRRGFFMRAEDFFRFIRRINEENAELERQAKQYEDELSGYGLLLAKGTALGQREANVERYGEDPDAASHGESFLHIFQERFVPGGLYLLDEPDTPLSPRSQLAFLSMVKEMALEKQSQFIIATHSPILMALPGASILSFDYSPPAVTPYEKVSQVALARDFLNAPPRFLRHL